MLAAAADRHPTPGVGGARSAGLALNRHAAADRRGCSSRGGSMDENGGRWDPAPFHERVCVVAFVAVVVIVAVSAVAGWLWPL